MCPQLRIKCWDLPKTADFKEPKFSASVENKFFNMDQNFEIERYNEYPQSKIKLINEPGILVFNGIWK